MKLVRTVKIKLDVPFHELKPTFDAYAKAFDLVCRIGWKDSDYNGVSLHRKTYQQCKDLGLPSQLAVSARMKATEALKSVRARRKKGRAVSCPVARKRSIRLDKNSYTVWKESRTVSFLAMDQRRKLKFETPACFERYMDWKNTEAELIERDSRVFLHVAFEKDVADVEPTGRLIGIDRGIRRIAVTSDGGFYGGGTIKQISKKYQGQRAQLQSKRTSSARRHLALVKGKERRFRADANHCISKRIVDRLRPGDTVVLEDLAGIRDRSKRMRKAQRSEVNRWSFFQLEQFLTYKALAKGVRVVHVDARYTSQRCSRCGHIIRSNRKCQSLFECKKCGFRHNADLNAAKNICLKYLDATGYPGTADVNQPNGRKTNAPVAQGQTHPSLAGG